MPAPEDARSASLMVALGEYDIGWHDPRTSLARAAEVVARAADAGARLVLLPETCTTGYTMEPLGYAEPLGGAQTEALSAIARRRGVWVLAGMALLDPGARAVSNAAVLFDARGERAAVYVKQRLFAPSGEPAHYAAGSGPVVVDVEGVRVSPFICYDLRFPELFRAVARQVDAFLLIANWPVARRAHWDLLVSARAVENLCYIAAVNRTGEGGGAKYDGGSAAYDPWGERLPDAGTTPDGERSVVFRIEAARVAETRARYPFLEDLRPVDDAV